MERASQAATRGARQTLRMQPCLRWPIPPNFGLSTQFLHVPQSSRSQPSHLPHRTLRGRFWPARAGAGGSAHGGHETGPSSGEWVREA